MDSFYTTFYPFQRGIGRFYRQYYWFPAEFMGYRGDYGYRRGYGNRGGYRRGEFYNYNRGVQ